MGAPALNRATARAATIIGLATISAIAVVAFLIAVTGSARAVRAALVFSFPDRDGWEDFAIVLWRNATLAATAFMLARYGTRWFAPLLLAGWAVNVGLAGAALGAYGARLVEHAAVYGLVELAGFSVVLATSLRLWREGGRPEGGELLAACALLAVAALSETVWAWRL